MWKNYAATSLATPEAFKEDPGLVSQFYSYRRHQALKAMPNPAHFALAELGRKFEGRKMFGRDDIGGSLTLSQNVDGLSPRADHPPHLLKLLHGSLFDFKCSNKSCAYVEINNFKDPLCPALDVSNVTPLLPTPYDKTGAAATENLYRSMNLPSMDTKGYSPGISPDDLPKCPKCGDLLRPGVVWFGERLPTDVIDSVDRWINSSPSIDIMLVVGTTAEVFPAAGYIEEARAKGARVAVVNMDASRLGAGGNLDAEMDWLFEGDAGEIVPKLLEPVIGKLDYAKLRQNAHRL